MNPPKQIPWIALSKNPQFILGTCLQSQTVQQESNLAQI